MRTLVTGGSGFIGRHLLQQLSATGHAVGNIDIVEPHKEVTSAQWFRCSILDCSSLKEVFAAFQPTNVIHLAAHAVMEGKSIDEFKVNTVGTANVLDAVAKSPSVERIIVTSTQHVRAPGSGYPRTDTDYAPYMLYGESKVITERITRQSNLQCAWTIIRPTAVWGPQHMLLADGLWRQLHRGIYFHPANDPVVRSYGYVKNVVWQIERLLQTPRAAVDQKVFYVADGNIRQLDWVNAVSRELTGQEVRAIPLWALRGLSKMGDGLRTVGLRFPLYDSRLKNMITPNPVPVEPTLQLLGAPPYSLSQGAKETAEWLKSYYRE